MSQHEQYKRIQFEAGLLNDLERYLKENELRLTEKKVTEKEGAAKEAFFNGVIANETVLCTMAEADLDVPEAPAPPVYAASAPGSAAPAFKKRVARRMEPNQTSGNLDQLLERADDTFQESLLKLIDARGRDDADVYKKADIDRRHFSKIRSNPDYRPKKQTALALALALELNLDETIDLIGRAGYAFSPASRADLIVRYCIEHHIYDLIEVNGFLYRYDQPLLGGQLA